MDATKYTPGPWAVNGNTPDQVYTEQGDTLAIVRGTRRISDEERNANARLIAAAPELLEALEKLANMVPEIARALPSGVPMAYAEAFDKARAALTKARGVAV